MACMALPLLEGKACSSTTLYFLTALWLPLCLCAFSWRCYLLLTKACCGKPVAVMACAGRGGMHRRRPAFGVYIWCHLPRSAFFSIVLRWLSICLSSGRQAWIRRAGGD